jgi:hypothetical protein
MSAFWSIYLSFCRFLHDYEGEKMKNKHFELQANGKVLYFDGIAPLRDYLKTVSGSFKVIDLQTKTDITDSFALKSTKPEVLPKRKKRIRHFADLNE